MKAQKYLKGGGWMYQNPIEELYIMHNNDATNFIFSYLGSEHVLHSTKSYSLWEPFITRAMLVAGE